MSRIIHVDTRGDVYTINNDRVYAGVSNYSIEETIEWYSNPENEDPIKAATIIDIIKGNKEYNWNDIPKHLGRIYFTNVTIPEGIVFPDSLVHITFTNCVIPDGILFPNGLSRIDFRNTPIPEGDIIPEDCKITNYNYK